MTRRDFTGLVLGAPALISGAESPQQKGRRLIDETLKAVGGDAFLSMKDRLETGRGYSFYREQLSGLSIIRIYTRYLTPPNPPSPDFIGVRERQAYGKNQDSSVLFADSKGYEITWRGARPLPEATLSKYLESLGHNIFYILRMRLKEPGLIFESRGSDVYQNMPVEIVDITDSANRTTTVYLHRSTKMPVRQSWFRRDPVIKDRTEEVTYFSKFRDVGDGVMWPFDVQRERDGEKVSQIYADSVVINKDLKDDLFTLPGNIKILKPQK